jgi:hypothetical protein
MSISPGWLRECLYNFYVIIKFLTQEMLIVTFVPLLLIGLSVAAKRTMLKAETQEFKGRNNMRGLP